MSVTRRFASLWSLSVLLLASPVLAEEEEAEEAEASASAGGSAQLDAAPAGVLAGFGRAGVFVLGAERLFGFSQSNTTVKIDDPAVSSETKISNTSLFFLASNPRTPFIAPRIGFDYFVANNISVGGSVGYTSDSDEGKVNGQNNDALKEKNTAFLFAPRAGYALMFSETFGLWPRLGVSYVSLKEETGNDNEISASMLAVSLEGNLVITPVPHAGFMIGPMVDFPLTGSGEQKAGPQTTELDTVKTTTFGLQAGLFIWL